MNNRTTTSPFATIAERRARDIADAERRAADKARETQEQAERQRRDRDEKLDRREQAVPLLATSLEPVLELLAELRTHGVAAASDVLRRALTIADKKRGVGLGPHGSASFIVKLIELEPPRWY